MLASFPDLLERSDGGALIGFTCYDLEVAEAVLQCAEDRGVPVLLLVSAQSFAQRGGARLMAALVAACATSGVPAGVQLDHCKDPHALRRAAELGACAVMADGSALPFEQNLELVRRAVEDLPGVAVEAELGRLRGDEDLARAAADGSLTDPDEAVQLVKATGLHALAVSVGNVHGEYHAEPRLDWARLDAVRDTVDVPLTLHGSSGLPAGQVQRALRSGVRKLNVNTELRKAYLQAGCSTEGWNVLGLHQAQVEGVRRVVEGWLDLVG